jgi:uncharacterized phage protein gp47/JayE
MAELTDAGLVIRRQPEIVEDLLVSYKEKINPDISIRDDEAFGQLTNIFALKISEVEQLIEIVSASQSPLTAEGTNLDDVGSLALVPRQAAAKSITTTQRFTEVNGFLISQGTVLENPVTLDRFETVNDINIAASRCVGVTYSVFDVLDSTAYEITINGITFTFTSGVSTTALLIATGLKAEIDGSSPSAFTVTLDVDKLVITSPNSTTFSSTVPAYLLAESVTALGTVEAINTGVIVAPFNSVTRMVTSSSVVTTNPDDYSVGRDREEDEPYRLRILTTSGSSGKATVPAIQDDVSLVVGVTTALVIENDLNTVDVDGRPAHSFETVVVGGLDLDIADAILTAKPAGIQSFGNTPVLTQDKYGNDKTVNFTRPLQVNLAFRVRYIRHTETNFPLQGNNRIKNAVLALTNALSIGADIIPLNYFGTIVGEVGALESLVIQVQQITNPNDAIDEGQWENSKLPISITQFPRTGLLDIDVAEVV